jgi:hypothetical protein
LRSQKNSRPQREEYTHPTFARIPRHHKWTNEGDEDQQPIARKHHKRRSTEEVFKCRHCRRFVTPPISGGHHRNHCPYCLYSRHVDEQRMGDRLSSCGASMQPIGYFQRPNGEYALVHCCDGCELERFNRIAADDDLALVLTLPEMTPRTSREMKLKRLRVFAEEWQQEEWQVDEISYEEEEAIIHDNEHSIN